LWRTDVRQEERLVTLMTEDIISVEQAGTLDGLMYQRVSRTPDALAYRSYDAEAKRWRDTSWGEVGGEISRWRAALAAEGLGPGERVAVHLRSR
jgi:long-chain acyl-CoA synthetase